MKLGVTGCRLLPGCAGGLPERTALVDIAVEDAPAHDPAVEERLRAAAVAFCPDQHLYDIDENGWPTGFLRPAAAGCGPTRWLGDWVIAMTVATQRWAHDPVWRGRVLVADPDRLRLAIPWHREGVFRGALEMAIRLVTQWVRPQPDRSAVRRIDREFRAGLDGMQAGGMNVDSLRFVETAARRGIPYEVTVGMVRYGWGVNAEYLDATVTGNTGALAAILAKHKAAANRRLAAAGVPVPRCRVVTSQTQARAAAAELGWPVVVKPLGRDMGVGVEPGIRDVARLDRACAAASRWGGGAILVESHVEGLCYRLLVVHGRMLAAVRRVPAGVTGDGEHSVAELIEAANTEPRRGTVINRLEVDGDVLAYLAEQGFRLNSVPAPGQQVWLRRTAYSETGGHHEDVTHQVHPDNRALAERIARLVRLDIAGIDLVTTDVTRSWREVGGAVCEVNAQPSLMPHWIAEPDRDINGEVLDILFGGCSPRIPTAVIAGAGPLPEVATMMHRIWESAGVVAGTCTRTQVRIGDEVFDAGDFPDLAGVQAVLAEPTVGAAVFEVSASDLADTGHGCDRYDVAAVFGDGQEFDEAFGDLLDRVSAAVVTDAVEPGRSGSGARHVLLTCDPAAAAAHRGTGGAVVFVAAEGPDPDGPAWIMLADGDRDIPVMPVGELGGHVPERAAMAAAALAWAQGVGIAAIRSGLASLDCRSC